MSSKVGYKDMIYSGIVPALGKLTIVRPFNGTDQATCASAGYRWQLEKLLLFQETPDLCWSNSLLMSPNNHFKKELRGSK